MRNRKDFKMEELALKLKKEYEKNHYQSLISTKCKCGRFAKVIMSNYVSGNTLYAIIYCKKCNKFFRHSGGSTLEVWGETTYSAYVQPIEYKSEEWNNFVKQIETGNIFASA
jgi:hypothetical protein